MPRPLRALLAALVVWHVGGQAQPLFQLDRQLEYAHPQLKEMSGLATGFRQPNVLWSHNDSGDTATIYALDAEGHVLGAVHISNAGAFDWEDTTSFVDNRGRGFLLLADIGDNTALRPFIDVYLVPEPRPDDGKTKALRRYSVFFPDGPRDVEAIAVDPRERMVYLLSKRELYPRLYRFSLDAPQSLLLPLVYLGEIKSLRSGAAPAPTRRHWKTSVTAMAFSPAGDAALVVTPGKSYYFPRGEHDSWLQALNGKPRTLQPGALPQIEAGSFSADGLEIYLGSEGSPARVVVFRRALP